MTMSVLITLLRQAEPDPEIPADAIDRKDFSSTSAWIDAMREQKRPGKVGSGVWDTGLNNRLEQSIYGYDSGSGLPVFRGKGVNDQVSFLFVHADGLEIRNCAFEAIYAPISKIDKSHSKWGDHWRITDRAPASMHYNASLKGLKVVGCTFKGCGICLAMRGEDWEFSDIHFLKNTVSGGSGGVALRAQFFRNFYLDDNVFRDMLPSKWHSGDEDETIFLVGRSNEADRYKLRRQDRNWNINVRRNTLKTYVSSHRSGRNASCFLDVRMAGGILVEDNHIEDAYNTGGAEGANCVYSKSINWTCRRNTYINCGGGGKDTHKDAEGGEGMVYTLKGGTANFLSEDEVFVGGPDGQGNGNPFISLGTAYDVEFRRPTFRNWNQPGLWKKNGPRGMIRNWSGNGYVRIIDPVVENCGFKGAHSYMFIVRADAAGPKLCQGWRVNWDGRNLQNIVFLDTSKATMTLKDCLTGNGKPITIDK